MQHTLLHAQNICTMALFPSFKRNVKNVIIWKAALHMNPLCQLSSLDHLLRKTEFESLSISHLNSVNFCWCCKVRFLHISRPFFFFLQSLEALLWLLLAQKSSTSCYLHPCKRLLIYYQGQYYPANMFTNWLTLKKASLVFPRSSPLLKFCFCYHIACKLKPGQSNSTVPHSHS